MNYPTETDNPAKADTYCGWSNYETWNVALWLDNDRYNYDIARMPSSKTYKDFIRNIKEPNYQNCDATYDYRNVTGDGISWTDPLLNIQELDEHLKELRS